MKELHSIRKFHHIEGRALKVYSGSFFIRVRNFGFLRLIHRKIRFRENKIVSRKFIEISQKRGIMREIQTECHGVRVLKSTQSQNYITSKIEII